MTSVSAALLPGDACPPAPLVPVGDVRVVPAAEWDRVVDRLGGRDTYTSRAYHEASALLELPGARPVLLHHRSRAGEVALPLLLRPLPGGGGWDATSAYGYGGPVSRGGCIVPSFGPALDA